MSEYKRANAFGTGYLDTDKMYKVKFENKTKKRFFEVAGDGKALEAFNKIPNEPVAYCYDRESKLMSGKDGKDYFIIEITTPENDRMMKTTDHTTYMKIINEYHIVNEGKWKEWGKNKSGNPIQVKVKD